MCMCIGTFWNNLGKLVLVLYLHPPHGNSSQCVTSWYFFLDSQVQTCRFQDNQYTECDWKIGRFYCRLWGDTSSRGGPWQFSVLSISSSVADDDGTPLNSPLTTAPHTPTTPKPRNNPDTTPKTKHTPTSTTPPTNNNTDTVCIYIYWRGIWKSYKWSEIKHYFL